MEGYSFWQSYVISGGPRPPLTMQSDDGGKQPATARTQGTGMGQDRADVVVEINEPINALNVSNQNNSVISKLVVTDDTVKENCEIKRDAQKDVVMGVLQEENPDLHRTWLTVTYHEKIMSQIPNG